MSLGVTLHHAHAYLVATPVYEGPLDLLLQLIERTELDITKLALAQVTDQYLDYIHELPELAVEEVSAFLVIAAKLLQIKSEVLLPRPPVREEGEEDPGEALARQLLTYKRYKEVAILLSQREAAGMKTYLRLAPSPKIETSLDMSGIGLPELISAAQDVFISVDTRPELRTVVSVPRITIRQKIRQIVASLQKYAKITFQGLFINHPSHLEIVVTFLALLELIKRNLVQVHQETLFGDIELEISGEWDEEDTFELEFGE
jgi:segregation and condensation protein A